jgi:hypothetical protein
MQAERKTVYKVAILIRRPFPVLFMAIAVSYVNATLRDLVLRLGSLLDSNEEQDYYLSNG